MGNVLYADLTYKIRGLLFEIRKEYGPGQKEKVYHRILSEKCKREGLDAVSEPQIVVRSHETGAKLGVYQPDMIVANKIILELKSSRLVLLSMRNSCITTSEIVNMK